MGEINRTHREVWLPSGRAQDSGSRCLNPTGPEVIKLFMLS